LFLWPREGIALVGGARSEAPEDGLVAEELLRNR